MKTTRSHLRLSSLKTFVCLGLLICAADPNLASRAAAIHGRNGDGILLLDAQANVPLTISVPKVPVQSESRPMQLGSTNLNGAAAADIAPVPEPRVWATVGLGFFLLFARNKALLTATNRR